MAFSETTKLQALQRANYRCEKCGKSVTMATCQAHHKTSVAAGGNDTVSNCKILCINCHKKTYTYGKH